MMGLGLKEAKNQFTACFAEKGGARLQTVRGFVWVPLKLKVLPFWT